MSYDKYDLTFVLLYIFEFIKLAAKMRKNARQASHFYLFSPTCLVNSIKLEHSCKILYVVDEITHMVMPCESLRNLG